MTKALVKYMRHVSHSSSLYPIGTLWLIAMVVIPLGIATAIGFWPIAIILTIVAGILTLAASFRDDRRETAALRTSVEHVTAVVNAQREALEARIRLLTKLCIDAGIQVPPEKES